MKFRYEKNRLLRFAKGGEIAIPTIRRYNLTTIRFPCHRRVPAKNMTYE